MKQTVTLSFCLLVACAKERTHTTDGTKLTLPERRYVAESESDLASHPTTALKTSKRFLLVALNEGVSKSGLTGLLESTGCALGGTVPALGLLQLDCGANDDFVRISAALAEAQVHPAVATATLDVLMVEQATPAPPSEPGADHRWQWTDDGGHNWGLKKIGAPAAWNLNAHIRKAQRPKVGVLIAEDNFDTSHPDLVDAVGVARPIVAGRTNHATQVAGIIGASWGNGAFIDGISPFVQLYPSEAGTSLTTLGWYLIEMFVQLTTSADPPRRLVNMSIGYPFPIKCSVPRVVSDFCDPTGRIAGATLCDPTDFRLTISNHARLFSLAAERLNERRPTLFVTAAGNESGPFAVDAPCNVVALGDFPAEYASPMNWAALHRADEGGKHIIVAMAMDQSGGRATYSNSNGSVYAPADGNYSLVSDGLVYGTDSFAGTSAAAPFVTGSAAFLLAIEPTLSNAELKTLLTDPKCTDAMPVAGLGRSINLFLAALCIDDLPGRAERSPRVRHWLADMDDGTQDGFSRVSKPDLPGVTPSPVERDDGGDGKVTMKDFRRLRDNIWLYFINEHPELAPNRFLDAEADNRKLDLNGDGLVHQAQSALSFGDFESFPRAGLNFDPTASWLDKAGFLGGDETDLEVLMLEYEPSADEPWPKSTLLYLLQSADLHVRLQARDVENRPDDALTAFAATGFALSVSGDPAAGDPVPPDLSALAWQTRSEREVVVTTPFRENVRVFVRPVCGESVNADREFSVNVSGATGDRLAVAEDRVVWLRKQDIPFCMKDCYGTIINDAPFCDHPPEDPVEEEPELEPSPEDYSIEYVFSAWKDGYGYTVISKESLSGGEATYSQETTGNWQATGPFETWTRCQNGTCTAWSSHVGGEPSSVPHPQTLFAKNNPICPNDAVAHVPAAHVCDGSTTAWTFMESNTSYVVAAGETLEYACNRSGAAAYTLQTCSCVPTGVVGRYKASCQ
jgi:subtilisin family serine protease